MSDLSSGDTIIISGIAKLALPVIAFFIVRAVKDIASQWLENQRVIFTTTHTVLQCACEPIKTQKEIPEETLPSTTQQLQLIQPPGVQALPSAQPPNQTPSVPPVQSTPITSTRSPVANPIIIDNYSQKKS